MSSRNVAVRKDVYEALQKEKRPQESFTRLFVRLLGQRQPLDRLVGAWGPLDRRRVRRLLEQLRRDRAEGRR